jgi:hypothetical protein
MAGATGFSTANNFAGGGAHVGAQANAIFGDVYQYAPDDPPERKFDVGVSYLVGGSALKARELIEEAIANDYQSSKVWFHLLLAVLSGRTFHQFSGQDLDQINKARNSLYCQTPDSWGRASQVIFRFFDSLRNREVDSGLLHEFDGLNPNQRDLILRHLDVFLKGPVEDHMWERERERASQVRNSSDRTKRVWMFFVPDPAKPRLREPVPPMTTRAEWFLATVTASLLAIAAGYTGWELLIHGNLPGLGAFIASCVGGWLVVVNGVQRQFLAERMRVKEAEHRGMRNATVEESTRKFAREVDQFFGYYFATCIPKDSDRTAWLTSTAGIRATLYAEMVDRYRGARISSGEIRWLIKHHVYEVRRCWQAGTFGGHRERFRPQPRVEALFAIGCIAVLAGGAWAVGLMTALPVIKAAVVIVALLSGWWTACGWLRITIGRKHYAAERAERDARMAHCEEALREWRETLAARPSDAEMALWLDADQKFLMNEALKHYKLTRSDVIAHAFIAEAAPKCKHHRVPGGPMRYSRYRMHVFLLTSDGVRQVVFNLNFRYGSHPIIRRTNYRFEAIAAVRFTQVPRSLELQLVGGQTIDIQLAEPNEETQPATDVTSKDPDVDYPLDVNLAPASLTNTIHMLEGIAAEGKEWVRREGLHSYARSRSFPASSTEESGREQDGFSRG